VQETFCAFNFTLISKGKNALQDSNRSIMNKLRMKQIYREQEDRDNTYEDF
jgi:hypothetical protein